MGLSNNVTASLNLVALLCSIPIIATGTSLASKADSECTHYFRWPLALLGSLVLLVSLAGFLGAYWNKQGLLAVYLFCMAFLICLLLTALLFTYVVTRPDGSYPVQGRASRDYRLEGFSTWLRDYVTDSDHWVKIRACLAESNVCTRLNQNFISADQFFAFDISPLQARTLSPSASENLHFSSSMSLLKVGVLSYFPSPYSAPQSGCCKPPTVCGYSYVNPTLWSNPANPSVDMDCYLWNNDQAQLCYSCSSCKAGLLGNLRGEWSKANVILIVTLVILICVYLTACSAFRNAQSGSHK
ncbi:hypothetical protein SAY87_027043 [Trapa incisa]|uniref:Tetraspanin-2 n=1 Tax=Trapa incisa TaxID=236973 RepID=A0AAN7H206_9MYRT|nr:hypothetical protein SAY87_027043 [Trapa incisa]